MQLPDRTSKPQSSSCAAGAARPERHPTAIAGKAGVPPMRSTDYRSRILLVASTLHVGGAEMVIADLARFLDRSRFHVSVCCLSHNGVLGRLLEQDSIPVTSLSERDTGRTDYLTSLKLRRFVLDHGIDIIHSHDIHGLADCSIVRCLVPSVRHIHTFHYGNYPNLDRRHSRIERLAWRRPDRLIAVGANQARAIEAYYRMKSGRLRIVRNGVADHKPICDDALTRLVVARRLPVIASISTLTKQKGLPSLLDAIALMKQREANVLLLMVGDGPLRHELEKKAAELGIADNVHFLGWIPNAARRVLPLADIFVQSSLWEAMSIVVLEAMAAEKPLVVTTVGENPSLLRHEESALLVPPGEPEALAAAITKLLTNREFSAQLAARARMIYESTLGVQTMARHYESEYADLIWK